jgi:hypothetical protein
MVGEESRRAEQLRGGRRGSASFALPFRVDPKKLSAFASWREIPLLASWREIPFASWRDGKPLPVDR